jgi:hypothetical protein
MPVLFEDERLLLCRRITGLCSEEYIKNINSLCEKMPFLNFGVGITYSNRCSLEG